MIKRDGKPVVNANPVRRQDTAEQHTRLRIADLTPLEGAVIAPTIAGIKAALRQGEDVGLPKAVRIDGEYLVTDGNNRIYARKDLGETEVDIRIVPSHQLDYHRRELSRALKRQRKGFAKFAVCASAEEREALIAAEQSDDEGDEWLAELEKQE